MPLCKIHCKKIEDIIEPAVLTEEVAEFSGAAILGGNDSSRFSYWACQPKEVFEFCAGQTEPFEKLQAVLERYELEGNSDLPKGMFVGGWIGYFGYELGRYIEKLPARAVDDLEMAMIRLGFYDRVIAYDRTDDAWWIIALEVEGHKETAEDKLLWLQRKIKDKKLKIKDINQKEKINSGIRSNMSKEDYLKAIEKIRRYIYEGDVYQINFSHRFECDYNARPIDLYHWQNVHNPSPYAAYLDAGEFAIVSASPEMFITIADRVISTKPIKGTRARCGTGVSPVKNENMAETAMPPNLINKKNFNELLSCEKERAELNMIIDLERNDLGRICQYGTIKVSQPRTIEAYPTVFHAVATVEGKLRDEISFCDVIKAMFPGGSITGAPKIRSMEIIDELEPTQRGVYTGSIGFIGIDGTVCLNIAIRTVIIRGSKAYAQTGGGIVYDSRPEAEWQETLTKAKALLEGIKAVNKSHEW
jgi:para-aminobenzoate synthetase component I